MKKGSVIFSLWLVLLFVAIVLGFSLFKCMQANKNLKEALPYLAFGENIDYFDLIGMDEKRISASDLKKNHPSLIFIFSRPCSPCNKNLIYWKKISEAVNGKVSIYGIVLDKLTAAYNFAENARLNFEIFVPEDLKAFAKHLKLKLNYSQTIFYTNRVMMIKLGELEGDEAVSIIKLARDSI